MNKARCGARRTCTVKTRTKQVAFDKTGQNEYLMVVEISIDNITTPY